ncbi:MAG TPA: glycoside hydrolase family 3 N-terminal domain-containing protein [Acidimicrobiales bacterium]|nr:glycoside hydrolase family 3 N-terminal domain-containing protein [Acidimicrobiales bacterium]
MPDLTARWLDKGLAGVVLFARNIPDRHTLNELCQAIRELKPDALIALDEEGGAVTRMEATTGSSWPGARVLGVVDDLALTARTAATIAKGLAVAGANVNLAPVADVVTCAANPVIGNRSFGYEPGLVARHVREWVRATQMVGVAACAKHFPGHGATAADSHVDLPSLELDHETLMDVHVAPFKAAIDADVAMLMTAHVRYEGISDRPATLSRVLLEQLARKELGFQGVIVTDALGMGAIARHTGVVAGAVEALNAGADLLCVDGSLELQQEVASGLREARQGRLLTFERLEEATERVRRLASRFTTSRVASAGEGPAGAPSAAGAFELGLAAARRALRGALLPKPLQSAPFVFELGFLSPGAGEVRMRLVDALRQRHPATTGLVVPPGASLDVQEAVAAAGGRPIVIATRDAYRKPVEARLVSELIAAVPGAVVVALGSEADMELAPGRTVPARGSAPPNLVAAAEVLLPLTS